MQTYIVQRGDTLYGISRQFGVSINSIKQANNILSNFISPGQVLKIPTEETSIIYIVKKGDSLYSIAKKYNTTVDELIRINNLKTTNLQIGQQLRIPVEENTQNYIIYTVKSGDNLYSIARKYDTTVDEIKKLNNLSSNLLSINQQLKIPTQKQDEPVENYGTYTVKSGDNLYAIARKYNITVDELKTINNLKSDLLSIGQVLKVPIETNNNEPTCYGTGYVEPSYVTYTVKSGDNLYSIARKFDTSVANLIMLNDLSSTNLSIGQVLKIREEK